MFLFGHCSRSVSDIKNDVHQSSALVNYCLLLYFRPFRFNFGLVFHGNFSVLMILFQIQKFSLNLLVKPKMRKLHFERKRLLENIDTTMIKISHSVKSVQIRSHLWSVFSRIRTRNNSTFGHFSRS